MEREPLLPQRRTSLQSSVAQGLPLRFQNLSVLGGQEDHAVETLASTLYDGLSLGALRRAFAGKTVERDGGESVLVGGIDGLVNQGELLLILGPPTCNAVILLRALSSPSDLHLSSDSHIDYGLLPSSIVSRPRPFASTSDAGRLRGKVVLLNQHDVHFASLSVKTSLLAGALAKTPKTRGGLSRREWATLHLQSLIQAVGLSHALDTKIGSASVQGLSGGERKRASVVESLLTNASVLLLESPINGLDSSSALSLLSFLRTWTQSGQRSLAATTPHIADPLYHQFDKVLVLNSLGRQVYFGSTRLAQSYFEALPLGYTRDEVKGEGIAEYIINCIEDRGVDAQLEKAWQASSAKSQLLAEMRLYEARYPLSACAEPVLAATESEKSDYCPKTSPFTVSFLAQVGILTRRQYSLITSELPTYVTKTLVNLSLSILVGTVFFQLPATTEAAFTRGSLLLLSIMFNGYLSLAELGKTIEGRDIVKRQGDYGFFSASALALARVAGDLPLIGVQVLLFGTNTYVLAGLERSLEKYCIYMTFVYVMALNLSALFRMFAAFSPTFDVAIRYCGLSLNILVVYAGYFIPTRSMIPALKFIHYIIDPISYAFEAVLANEFHNLDLVCAPADIVPYGPSYNDTRFQTCSLPGSSPGSLLVSGDNYLAAAYDFHHDRLWYNLVVLLVQAVAFFIIGIVATEFLEFAQDHSKRVWVGSKWMERFSRKDTASNSVVIDIERDDYQISNYTRGSVLVWNNISLWVDTELDTRKLLDNINGYVAPGSLTVLLGRSGAGKSTLLNVLAGRSGDAVVKGTVLVDGAFPSAEYYRTTGYVQQFDHHDDRATVREALEFSALLRQDSSISRADKLAYVDVVLELLDLQHLSDAIIGTPSAGINNEQRKRLTIAVEVVARPAILFCDEPTTSLDSKSALRVVKLLKRLSRTGIAVIATIHQPSAEAFSLFDNLLLLEAGGRQVYFGPRQTSVAYFRSTPLEKSINPADYLLEAASTESSSLAATWKASPEAAVLASSITSLSINKEDVVLVPLQAASVPEQCYELTKRVSRHFYRDPSFSYTKLYTAFAVALIIGLSFFQVAKAEQVTIVSLQNRMFSIFLILFVPPVFMNVLIFKQHRLRGLFVDREGPSKIYTQTAFVTSLILSEIPYSLVCATIYFALFYFLIGFPLVPSTLAYSFVMIQLFFFFQSTWAMWITALAPNLGTIANLLPFFLCSMEIFNGALMPYVSMPMYWRWLYWVSPFQWYVRGLLGTLIHDLPVSCSTPELVSFNAPPGTSCGAYAAQYLLEHAGYLVDSTAESVCTFCKFSTADDFLATLNIQHSDRFLSLGIFLAYTLSNVVLIYALTYYPPGLIKLTPGAKRRAEIAAEMEGVEEMERLAEENLAEAGRGGL